MVNTWLAHKVVSANPRPEASVYGVCMFSIGLSGRFRPKKRMHVKYTGDTDGANGHLSLWPCDHLVTSPGCSPQKTAGMTSSDPFAAEESVIEDK